MADILVIRWGIAASLHTKKYLILTSKLIELGVILKFAQFNGLSPSNALLIVDDFEKEAIEAGKKFPSTLKIIFQAEHWSFKKELTIFDETMSKFISNIQV
jgi:hypothetical protein